jgi:transcriptional regulator with XRE-family HTH domain
MDANILRNLRMMAELELDQMAVMLNVTPDELREMEEGRRDIPARFDADAYEVAGEATWED